MFFRTNTFFKSFLEALGHQNLGTTKNINLFSDILGSYNVFLIIICFYIGCKRFCLFNKYVFINIQL